MPFCPRRRRSTSSPREFFLWLRVPPGGPEAIGSTASSRCLCLAAWRSSCTGSLLGCGRRPAPRRRSAYEAGAVGPGSSPRFAMLVQLRGAAKKPRQPAAPWRAVLARVTRSRSATKALRTYGGAPPRREHDVGASPLPARLRDTCFRGRARSRRSEFSAVRPPAPRAVSGRPRAPSPPPRTSPGGARRSRWSSARTALLATMINDIGVANRRLLGRA